MGSTFRFLAVDDEAESVLAWFRALPDAPEEAPRKGGAAFYFRSLGPLVQGAHGVDLDASPVALFFAPRKARGVLWTAGEVHFRATPLRERFPALAATSRKFGKWLARNELVFSQRAKPSRDWSYYLEGSLQNFDPDIHALPKAVAALERGQYFVADDDDDGDGTLDRVCHALRLRGVQCTKA
jgi:hypothetical protein